MSDALHCTPLYFTLLDSNLLYSALLYITALNCCILYSTLLHATLHYSNQHYSILPSPFLSHILPYRSLYTPLFITTTKTDPSKVEMRVLQQMRQRELNHEMRNLSAKLTPAERRAKRNAKLQEDTSRQVFIAVFRIKDFSDAKHRWVGGDD